MSRTDRAEDRRLDDAEQQWKASFKEPGDYLAGEPPTVDDPAIGYRPDSAPYPHHWSADRRVEMTWWAQRENVKVDYDPDLPDEGASGWEAAWASMERITGMQRARIDAAKAAALNPTGTLPDTRDYVDPGEPRHPRDDADDIGEW
jgi:hypothetical protein